ncbi:MAG: hypothetical protein U0Q03_00090 [Acidimicrobiales bacterium]
MTFILFALAPVALLAPFALRRLSEVRGGRRAAWTRTQRVAAAAVAAVNVLPYMPVWPGSTSPDGFLRAWAETFTVLSLPFWSLELLLWIVGRHRPLARRCAVACGVAYIAQASLASGAQVELIAAYLVIRVSSGGLLWLLARPSS